MQLTHRQHFLCLADLSHVHLQASGNRDLPADDCIYNRALLALAECLRPHSKTLADFPGMPTPTAAPPSHSLSAVIQSETSYNRRAQQAFYESALGGLNADQRLALDAVCTAITAPPEQVRSCRLYGVHSIARLALPLFC